MYEVRTQDASGVWHTSEKERKVFCRVRSVGQREWYEGGRAGLNPELQVTMFVYDYHGEEIVQINGQRYTVYRTYIPATDEIELYLQRKEGDRYGKD